MKRVEFWKEVQRALGIPENDIDGLPGPQTYSALKSATAVEIAFEYEMPEPVRINGEPPWITVAKQYIGTEEIQGEKNEPRVLKWWKLIRMNYTSDEIAWCAAYVGGVLEEIEIASTRSAWALDYKHWGQACDLTFGAIAVFRRESGGHVGFVMGADARGNLMILGGNQGNAVNIAPYPRANLVATRWPKDYQVPEAASLPQL